MESFNDICARSSVEEWLEWWNKHKYHVVPAFHGFGITGLNLAETGHGAMMTKARMKLSVAVWCDTCHMIIQDEDLKPSLKSMLNLLEED